MHIIRTKSELKQLRQSLKGAVGFVPTMGALHAGHIALIQAAKAECDHVVASIFVNPTQFGPNEDLEKYPRTEEADCALLQEHGVSLVYMPSIKEIYPDEEAMTIFAGNIGTLLCGASRPGHFDGVAQVVMKLCNQVQPDNAFFGEKDFQQLAIIQKMIQDFDIPVEVVGVPTVREEDGLAMSSRNRYLTPEERAIAPELYKQMQWGAEQARNMSDSLQSIEKTIENNLLQTGFAKVDYVSFRHSDSLQPLGVYGGGNVRLFVAAFLGSTRLIDNISI